VGRPPPRLPRAQPEAGPCVSSPTPSRNSRGTDARKARDGLTPGLQPK
jgi:hypothetical protein